MMGYYTDFTISWDDKTLEKVELYSEIVENGDTIYSVKWYEHDADMQELSKQHPNVHFTLTGCGEEAPDFWKRCYFNGKVTNNKHGEVILVSKNFTVWNFKQRFKAQLISNPMIPPEDVLTMVFDEFGIEEWL
jgi:hypothetical protein